MKGDGMGWTGPKVPPNNQGEYFGMPNLPMACPFLEDRYPFSGGFLA